MMAGPTRLMALEEVRVKIIAVRRVSRVRRVQIVAMSVVVL